MKGFIDVIWEIIYSTNVAKVILRIYLIVLLTTPPLLESMFI
jgi:hypothetical protein